MTENNNFFTIIVYLDIKKEKYKKKKRLTYFLEVWIITLTLLDILDKHGMSNPPCLEPTSLLGTNTIWSFALKLKLYIYV